MVVVRRLALARHREFAKADDMALFLLSSEGNHTLVSRAGLFVFGGGKRQRQRQREDEEDTKRLMVVVVVVSAREWDQRVQSVAIWHVSM